MSKLSVTGENPEVLTTRFVESSRARSRCPTLVMGATRKQSTCCLPSGFQKFLVHSMKELEMLLMCNKSFWAEIVHNVSSKNCKAIVERAAPLAIRVTSPSARLCSKENE
ncbi:60S ribosomal protein L32 [Plecturocebus cupreus]